MNDFVEFEPASYDLESSEDMVGLAKSLLSGRCPGILATVDREGKRLLDGAVLKFAWARKADISHTFITHQFCREPRFVAIETVVDSIECD